MTDEQEQNVTEPPDPMTECCSRFFSGHVQLFNFLDFISGLALRMDEGWRKASVALYRTDDEEEKERYKRSLEKEAPTTSALRSYSQLILQMIMGRAVDDYLAYISDLMTLIFRTRPETLRSSETVRVDAILRHNTMEDLVSDLAERRVNQLSYQGMRDLSDYLCNRLGFDLFEQQEDLQRAVVAIEVRNLIVHNRAVVNAHFLSRLPDYPASAGEVLKLEVNSVLDDALFLSQSVADIDTRAAAKFGLPQPVCKKMGES